MNKIIITSVLLFLAFSAAAQKVIENPRYGIKSTHYIDLTKVELTNDATILSFHVTIPQNNWVAIHEKSYIQPVGDTTKLYITKAEGAEIGVQVHWEKDRREEISYRLFFPPVNSDVTKIDFGEPVANSWNFYDVEIREIPHRSPVPDELLGSWFSTGNGNWAFSFFDSLAVYDGKTWEYASVSPSDEGFEVSLKNQEAETMLHCISKDKNQCVMQSENSPLSTYSKDAGMLAKMKDDEPFDVPLVNPGKVVYSGFIRGYSPRLGVSTGMIRHLNPMNNQMENYVIHIQKNGSFSVEFPLDLPQEISVSLPSGGERVFFEPGKPLFHLTNSKTKDYPSLFMGESAAVNYGFRATQNIATAGTMEFMLKIGQMNPEEYIDFVLATKKEETGKLEALQKEQNIIPKVVQIRKMDIDFRAAHHALRYHSNKRLAQFYAQRNNPDLEYEQPDVSQELDIGLLQQLGELPVNSGLALSSSEYFNFIQALYYTDIKRPQTAYFYHLSSLGDYLKKKGVNLTGEENDMLQFINLNLVDEYNEEESRNFNQAYREVVQKFLEKYQNEFSEISNRFYRENLKTNLQAFGLEFEGLPVEIFEVKTYLSGLKNAEDKTDEAAFTQTKNRVKTDYLKELMMSAYYRKKAELEVNKNDDTPELKTEGDKLFDSIIRKFRGKVIYVDFWATWCGPCLAGIEKIKPLKEELAGEDVVFLYITNPTSPENEYEKKIPDIKGEHVRVSGDEWNYLTEKFNIYGIPHYALVDQSGKIVNAHLMQMENSELKKRLLEQLGK